MITVAPNVNHKGDAQMRNTYKKIIKYLLGTLFIFITLVLIVPIPVHKELKAIGIKMDDPDYLEYHTISISGSYRFNLFRDNVFDGQISVSGYPLTYKQMYSVQFHEDYEGSLRYVYETGVGVDGYPQKEFYSFGEILTNRNFVEKTAILVFEQDNIISYTENQVAGGSWTPNNGCCIVSNVSSREDALNILAYYDIYPVIE